MPQQDRNVRRAAVSALRAWSKGHAYAETLVDKQAQKNKLSSKDRALLNSILLCVLRNRSLLDHWIGKLRRGQLDPETRDILRVGLSQLLILGIPDHAATNETVNCGRAPVRGLINAVLRSAVKSRAQFQKEISDLPAPVEFSCPPWLWKKWKSQFGEEASRMLLAWNNEPAKVYARLNPLKHHSEEIPPELLAHLTETDHEGFYQIQGGIPTEWLANGMLYIQDPATRHSIKLLAPKPGETILDACAAPGGKAALAAAAMENKGALHCTDSNAKRLPRLLENLQTAGCEIAQVSEHDWTSPAPSEWNQRFDGILLDVPCSNTGVFRRRVDARWRIKPETYTELRSIQLAILENALPCLKPGGRLVYSTCSIDREENQELVRAFLELHPELQLDQESQVLPFLDGTDGAYSARMKLAPDALNV